MPYLMFFFTFAISFLHQWQSKDIKKFLESLLFYFALSVKLSLIHFPTEFPLLPHATIKQQSKTGFLKHSGVHKIVTIHSLFKAFLRKRKRRTIFYHLNRHTEEKGNKWKYTLFNLIFLPNHPKKTKILDLRLCFI
ncbi:hypothetical protein NT07LI_2869 [Listeria innocua FSL S4-378]|nr:hypothetical protein NT07LI_2869 [Listeria innocua FSL S4-378]